MLHISVEQEQRRREVLLRQGMRVQKPRVRIASQRRTWFDVTKQIASTGKHVHLLLIKPSLEAREAKNLVESVQSSIYSFSLGELEYTQGRPRNHSYQPAMGKVATQIRERTIDLTVHSNRIHHRNPVVTWETKPSLHWVPKPPTAACPPPLVLMHTNTWLHTRNFVHDKRMYPGVLLFAVVQYCISCQNFFRHANYMCQNQKLLRLTNNHHKLPPICPCLLPHSCRNSLHTVGVFVAPLRRREESLVQHVTQGCSQMGRFDQRRVRQEEHNLPNNERTVKTFRRQ